MGRIILQDGIVYTGQEVLPSATVVLEGGRIVQIVRSEGLGPPVGKTERFLPRPDDEIVDAAGFLVTPGLVNAHTHIYSALARGISLKDPPPENFPQNLERIWWRLDRALTLDDIDLSARLFAAESLHAGVTTLFDHHASERSIRGSLSTLAGALGEAGLKACLCFEVSDREGADAARQGCEENATFLREATARGGSGIVGLFGLHASFTLGAQTLKACVLAAGETGAGFHIHLAEDRSDQEITRKRDGVGVVERLATAGVLGSRTLCVHGVHLDQAEIEILATSQSWLVHCPESNMNNGVGAAALGRLRAAGVRLALGTDGFTSQMTREALVGSLLQNHLMSDPRSGGIVAGLLFGTNADLAGQFFGPGSGRCQVGAPADVVLWDYRPPTPLTTENFWGHLLFGLVNARARDVFVDGRSILRGGKVLTIDEEELREGCLEAAPRLWERF